MTGVNTLLGDFLVEKDLITKNQLEKALQQQQQQPTRKLLGRTLIELGFVEENKMIQALSKYIGIKNISLQNFQIPDHLIRLIPEEIARKYNVLPLFQIRDILTLAMSNPLDLSAIDAVSRETLLKVEPIVCKQDEIINAVNHYYKKSDANHSNQQQPGDNLKYLSAGNPKKFQAINRKEAVDMMNNKPSILVVDDEKDLTQLIEEILVKYQYDVKKAHTGYDALQMLNFQRYDLVILDLIMPEMSGIDTFKKIKKLDTALPVIILTGDDRIDTVVEAMKMGAYDYLSKPIDWNKLRISVKNALTTKELKSEVSRLKNQLQSKYKIENIVGASQEIKAVLRSAERVLGSDVPVNIIGENGTGKELLARAIHFQGKRKDKPFITVSSECIPEHLLESELFGHEAGVFAGALSRRTGKFEQADGGTLFMDEIGRLSTSLQVKLLRVLQEGEFERFGGTATIKVDVRVISATKLDLMEEVKKNRFREDLYYRLFVFPIHIPPLRERPEDIPELVNYFLNKFNKKNNVKIKTISKEFLNVLKQYDWPGNVRELETVIERSMLNAHGSILKTEDLPIAITVVESAELKKIKTPDAKKVVELGEAIIPLKEIEKEILKQALKLSNYNMSTTALELGIGRTTLYRKLQRYKIKLDKITQ